MQISSLSDLARSLYLRRDNAQLKTDMFEATRELSTGQHANLVTHLSGDLGPLADIERSLKTTESFLVAISEQRLRADTAQDALGSIRDVLSQAAGPLLLVQEASDAGLIQNAGVDALARFSSVVGTLNTSVGGASLFAGIASDRPALASADTILSELVSEISAAGATTAQSVGAVVDAWFAPGGGYETVGYTGGARPADGVLIAEGAVAQPLQTAQAAEIREALSSLALAALIGRGVLDASPDEQATLARDSGLRLIQVDESIVRLQADLGTQQSRISFSEAENRARLESLEMHRAELVGVDPFDAATRVQETQAQLESLYAMTARISRLSLTEYLR